eukprot:TRINITY_DN3058_c0_g1_i1.p1 TRINITY_DN3058_c0_g1~~TRINITY_DN3058_c0_g1_i1.p1  ORF type:complete len:107 (+),score=23.67 TRINITY_DN3058_c0_g1_i1:120-440(+)
MSSNSGIAVGLNKGHKITSIKKRKSYKQTSRRIKHPRTAFAREVIREVSGFAPYEKRLLELLRNNQDKKSVRFAKRRLGTQNRAIRKKDEMTRALQQERMAAKKKE